MKIKRLRKKLKDKKFLEKKYNRLTEEAEHWHHFLTFECHEFFVGEEREKYNSRVHEKNMKRVNRQIEFIESLLGIDTDE